MMCGFREPFGECVVMHQLVAMRFKLALDMSNVIEPRGEKAFGLDQDLFGRACRDRFLFLRNSVSIRSRRSFFASISKCRFSERAFRFTICSDW